MSNNHAVSTISLSYRMYHIAAFVPKIFLSFFLLSAITLWSCTSLSYVKGIYDQEQDQQVDVVVRVQDKKGIALTNLTLNDFYILHNDQALERKNNLGLNEKLSAVKLYLAIVVDQRENPSLKGSFERTRGALKAYLTLKPDNIYIKLLSYDTQARALNADFTNDKSKLQSLLEQLDAVQIPNATLNEVSAGETSNDTVAIEKALMLAEESITSLPHGSRALDPQIFREQGIVKTEDSPLYNSAILLMNHNQASLTTIAPYAEQYNFVILDSTESLAGAKDFIAARQANKQIDQGGEQTIFAEEQTIFDVYELAPGHLNKDENQARALKVVNQVCDVLNNIVNGYYWLTYQQYTDFNRVDPNLVTVALTQHGRPKVVGGLSSSRSEFVARSDDSSPDLLHALNVDAKGKISGTSEDESKESDALINTSDALALWGEDLLPPALTEEPPQYEDLLALLPGQYQGSEARAIKNPLAEVRLVQSQPTEHEIYQEAPVETPPLPPSISPSWSEMIPLADASETDPEEDRPAVEDFEILNSLTEDASPGHLVRNDAAPQFTAEPIRLVAAVATLGPEEPIELPKEETLPADLTNGRYIQVGAFIKLSNLYDVVERMSQDYDVRAVTSVVDGKRFKRCIIGPFASEEETEEVLSLVKSGSLQDAFIIRQPIEQWLGE